MDNYSKTNPTFALYKNDNTLEISSNNTIGSQASTDYSVMRILGTRASLTHSINIEYGIKALRWAKWRTPSTADISVGVKIANGLSYGRIRF